jgi:dihydroneopterin aldolase
MHGWQNVFMAKFHYCYCGLIRWTHVTTQQLVVHIKVKVTLEQATEAPEGE